VDVLRKTPLHDVHRQLGAKLIDFGGWDMPVSYPAGTIKEHKAVREAVGLFDVSHMGEVYLRGPKAREVVAKLTTNAVESAPNGKAVYTLLCHPHGGVVDDCIFYKRADDDFMVIVNASNTAKDIEWFLDHASVLLLENTGPRLWRLTRVTHDTLGPRALLLSKDEKKLYVADGDVERGNVCQLFEYTVTAGREVAHGKPLITFQAVDRGIEGMCLDSDGNIIACAGWKKSGVGPMLYVISPSGTIIESHPAPADMPMRCAFGDAGLGSLYVTAGDGVLYRAKNTGRKGLSR